jgi:HTH-type transcriptional regulator/antitoxin HigA
VTQARRRPAEVFPPGDFIAEELEARGWSQGDLARILGRLLQALSAVIRGKEAITRETAVGLGAAFGTSAEIWLNLENSSRLHRAGPADPDIAERAVRLDRGGRKALADDISAQETPRAAGRVSRPTKRSRSQGV